MEIQEKKENKNIGGGLLPLKRDSRDFKIEEICGFMELPEEDFTVSDPLKIKDQGGTDMCVAFAATAVSQDQEGVILSPEYLFTRLIFRCSYSLAFRMCS